MRRPDRLLERVSKSIGAPGLEIGAFDADPHGNGRDGRMVVRFRGKEMPVRAAVRLRLRPAAIVQLDQELRRQPSGMRRMVISDHIGKDNAKLLRDRGFWYADAIGNIYIDLSEVYILVHGMPGRPGGRETDMHGGNHLKPLNTNWLKIVFSILSDPFLDSNPTKSALNGTARRTASEAGVALGSVGTILRDLEARGFVARETGDRRVLLNRAALLERWATEYAERLRPKLVRGRFRSTVENWWQSVTLPAGALLGGEAAAAELTGYLRPERAALYAAALPDSVLVRADLRPDPDGEVEWLVPFWGTRVALGPKGCVHPLIVYAELLADADPRNVETARRIHEQYLRSIIEAA